MQESAFYSKLAAVLGPDLLGREELTDRDAAVVAPSALLRAVDVLRGEGFDLLMDLGGADYSSFPGEHPQPLCVSYQFLSTASKQRAWLKAYLPMENPEIESLTPLFAGANWYERECWDMYGVKFKGHPHLKRLLLYEEFEGHPLRKSYPIMKSQPLIPMRNAVDYEAVAVKTRQEAGS